MRLMFSSEMFERHHDITILKGAFGIRIYKETRKLKIENYISNCYKILFIALNNTDDIEKKYNLIWIYLRESIFIAKNQ